ncbi:LOW QUALITY PROTEIN: hypothetical protein RJ639_018096, partial [Escallonia herrerae]
METLGILDEIQALVCDKLQVVSYKWLSRNFLISSNAAKRLLQQFAEKHGSELEVVYSVSGWLKNNPSVYHIRLVSRPKLSEAKGDFDDNCSVYSVQACILKDPAALWNAEFVQAEELFKQPPTVINCLRDNRFCGVINSFVKRNPEGTSVGTAFLQAKSAGAPAPFRNNSAPQPDNISLPQHKKFQQSSPNISLQSPNVVKDIKNESHGAGARDQGSKPSADKEKDPELPATKKIKGASGTGGSLASMWGRASTKSKSISATTKISDCAPNSVATAEAQIFAREAVENESSDDDGENVKFKRGSNGEGSRKRRVVFDFSDDEDECKDAVSLASPDPPKSKSSIYPQESSKSAVPQKNNLNFVEQNKDDLMVKEDTDIESKKLFTKESGVSNDKESGISSSDKIESRIPQNDAVLKGEVINSAPNSPKRKKVFKTRIDERGREVTEVVWEGDEAEKKPDSSIIKKSDNGAVNTTVNRPSTAKKSPAIGGTAPLNPTGKAGNKKAGNKDPKQGNIMSFFRKECTRQ